MKRLSLIVAAAMSLLWLTFSAAPAAVDATVAWLEHRPVGGGYRVEMPGVPKRASQRVEGRLGDATLIFDLLDLGTTAYGVSYADLPDSIMTKRTVDQLLDDSRKGIVKNMDGSLVSSSNLQIEGHSGRSFTCSMPMKNACAARNVLVGNRIFQLIYVGPKGTETGAEATRFLESFQLVP